MIHGALIKVSFKIVIEQWVISYIKIIANGIKREKWNISIARNWARLFNYARFQL